MIECALSDWWPGIDDPDLSARMIVVGYVIAGVFSFALAFRQRQRIAERIFCAISGAGLLFLSVDKQLDLQSFLTAAGRCASKSQGWYDSRRTAQLGFIVGSTTMVAFMGSWFCGLCTQPSIGPVLRYWDSHG